MLISAGRFSAEVWFGGYPVTIKLVSVDPYKHQTVIHMTHLELMDLEHVVKRAKRGFRQSFA